MPLTRIEKFLLSCVVLFVPVVAVGAVLYRPKPVQVEQPPGCCIETRDDKFIRVVGADCPQWRLAIPGCP